MSPCDASHREYIRKVILERLDKNMGSRGEALQEFFSVTMSGADTRAVEKISELVPPLLPELYEKWVGMFLERFFETVPVEQIQALCSGKPDDDATLILIYLMFLESERMEAQIDKDLRAYGVQMTGAKDNGDLAASYIRAKMGQLGKELKGPGKK